jgi:prepilin-type N-terminal cleavage/methylation domain-containing protein
MIKIKIQKGFTLIEVLVAITIFMIFITSVSSAYLDIAKSQREANAVRAVYSEMRYIFDLIGSEVRSKTVDYGCPGSVASQTATSAGCVKLNGVSKSNYIALVDNEGTQRTIFLVEDDLQDEKKKLYYYKEQKDLETFVWNRVEGFENGYTEIVLKNIEINNFVFEASPLVDPFDPNNIGCGAIQFQPAVSIYTTIKSANEQAGNFELDLQTTISSRVYNRQTNL